MTLPTAAQAAAWAISAGATFESTADEMKVYQQQQQLALQGIQTRAKAITSEAENEKAAGDADADATQFAAIGEGLGGVIGMANWPVSAGIAGSKFNDQIDEQDGLSSNLKTWEDKIEEIESQPNPNGGAGLHLNEEAANLDPAQVRQKLENLNFSKDIPDVKDYQDELQVANNMENRELRNQVNKKISDRREEIDKNLDGLRSQKNNLDQRLSSFIQYGVSSAVQSITTGLQSKSKHDQAQARLDQAYANYMKTSFDKLLDDIKQSASTLQQLMLSQSRNMTEVAASNKA